MHLRKEPKVEEEDGELVEVHSMSCAFGSMNLLKCCLLFIVVVILPSACLLEPYRASCVHLSGICMNFMLENQTAAEVAKGGTERERERGAERCGGKPP